MLYDECIKGGNEIEHLRFHVFLINLFDNFTCSTSLIARAFSYTATIMSVYALNYE